MNERGAAARIWCVRERTELEAAALFEGLARDLEAARAPAPLVALARRSAADERVHAVHCRRIVDALEPGMSPLTPDLLAPLGPPDADPARRALYASVAIGCITESLSTALLIELRAAARMTEVCEGLDVILRDEVRHSRLGWACLAYAAERGDVGWLSEWVPAMLEAALAHGGDSRLDLRAYGILPRADVDVISRATIETTILPGLRLHGIDIAARSASAAARKEAERGR